MPCGYGDAKNAIIKNLVSQMVPKTIWRNVGRVSPKGVTRHPPRFVGLRCANPTYEWLHEYHRIFRHPGEGRDPGTAAVTGLLAALALRAALRAFNTLRVFVPHPRE
ncbi:hypothetical protein TspCOW1_24080 [Thiohalobacter sp. COW1]|nr:hypothetical protein TspCOW1_24080 [Thiohalobacter sp. COW1]